MPEADPPAPDASGIGISPGSVLLDLNDAERAADLDRIVELGAEWIRLDIDWSRIEVEPGRDDWATTDALVAGARARGLDVVGLIAYTPTWARPDGTPDKAPPIDSADFGRFVERVVERYHPFVRAWEIWNEPNVSSFWHPSPDPEGYASLLETASAAIRERDAGAVIITGGLAPALDVPGVELSPLTFLGELYTHSSPGTFDAIGLHPYTYPGRPTETQEWNQFAAIPELRVLIGAQGDEAPPIWVTEYGAPTGVGERAVSESEQAAMIGEALSELDGEPWVGPLFVYSLRDLSGGSAGDIEANFGLFRADGEAKPAADAVREFALNSER